MECFRPENSFYWIAGPCSAESEQSLLEVARKLKESGYCQLFRAGAWKPRTRPGTFEGFGLRAVRWLLTVQREIGLPVATEAANAEQAHILLHHGFDAIWLGARTTVNPFLVQEIADVVAGAPITVIVKNPINADLKLWIGATERILKASPAKVMAVHRGFQSYDEKLYRYSPRWDLAIQYMAALPSVPLLCDPSHIAGRRDLIPEVAKKALELGMAGLMVEVHLNPAEALSDSAQQLTPEAWCQLASQLVHQLREAQALGHESRLERLRIMIDSLDDELFTLLARRLDYVDQIGQYKNENNIPIFQPDRWEQLHMKRSSMASRLNLSPEFVESIINAIYAESMRRQTLIYQKSPSIPADPRLEKALEKLGAG
ncbi:MAG: bifunctional 3-deoxy-7-phosphoheptulonate synthase/chorismate mutase type II [Flavobacteriales bacterium]|nr:bifunctional 3-deoxy-7-phosphoheptulonate synthase/chorismate mutase type II [Flavobacteriales bacterium]MCX7768556.1 bifunctional 3-deoxy-7-phosphoheptulonate synthase/chorismate mutase type II [Flavobacteriales bacterium]MDW8409475.1 bifunctional 3-deoxy-7-phosphoheptulonate synthase/chorismate mutase type II [Flavobacteriales bacterium]